MRNKMIPALALALAFAGASTNANAGYEQDHAAPGAFVGAGGLFAIELFDGPIDAGNSRGFNLRAGYRVHPNVAVEALYEYYSEFDTDPAGNISGWSVSANAKAYPMLGRWQPYALLGLGYLGAEAEFNPAPGSVDDGGFMMRFGGGMDVHLTDNWQIGPELAYVLPFGDVDDLAFLTISGGVRYSFN